MFSVRRDGEVLWVAADRVPPGLRHGFSTRVGGVSEGVYGSLNLGFCSDDEPSAVAENWRRFKAAVGVEGWPLAHLTQVHGTSVRRVRRGQLGEGTVCLGEGDALWTDEPGCVLAVVTADCVPVVIHGRGPRPFVAVAHAGWRGVAGGILAAVVGAIAAHVPFEPSELTVVAGPAIGECCFEVGSEVADELRRAVPGAPECPPSPRGGERRMVPLAGLVGAQARAVGVPPQQILICDLCTCCHEDRFFSYRRANGEERGRMGTVAALVEGPLSGPAGADGAESPA